MRRRRDGCAFSGDAAARFAALARQLRKEPVEVVYDDGTSELVDYTFLIGNTLGAMYDPFSWPDFAQLLAAVEAAATSARTAARTQRFRYERRLPYLTPHGIRDPGSSRRSIRTSSRASRAPRARTATNPHSYALLVDQRRARRRPVRLLRPAMDLGLEHLRRVAGLRPRPLHGPVDRATANPVLIVGNRYDPATRYEGAITLHSLMPRSALLTLEGWGHTSLFLSACVDQAISSYLIGIVTPPEGATCEQDVVPFA